MPGHDRDFIRGEMFRQIESVRAGNESSCQPCAPAWKAFQGSCYFFSTDNLTWTQANESCAQKQAHLVIINSQAEQDFLTPTEQVTHWIGLFRKDGGGWPQMDRWFHPNLLQRRPQGAPR
ncbi:C-type lectin domain family 4 member G-like [Dasypus novemcinctus]|uniref:C-type lectin domain family 4 member G-like n=1 Tax=Dasypus novemcinctus TaxID=9361 RepID=UPI00265F399A|nr:C-type lectin domain family 4 member G-like [Dasypus novemcinctus]